MTARSPIAFATLLVTAVVVAGCEIEQKNPALVVPPVGAPATTRPASTATRLATGRMIDPSQAVSSVGVGSLPVNLILSPDGKYAITTGAGYREQICAVRLSDGTEAGKVEFRTTKANVANGLYYGLAFGPDGKLYAAMGAAKKVAVLTLGADGSLERDREIETGEQDFPAGIAIDRGGRLFVAHNDPVHLKTDPFGAPASLSIHNSATGKELGRFTFKDDLGLSTFPLSVAVTGDGSRTYVTSERDSAVYVLDTADAAHIVLRATLTTGSHPISLLLNQSQSRLFVANAHSDTISVIDTAAEKVVSTILVRPQVAKDLAGATPTGMALSFNEKFLYATLDDMNAVAVIDLLDRNGPELEGYIPTGWYPTSVAVAGDQLVITNAKGDQARIPHDFTKGGKSVASPLTLYKGTVWRIAIPKKDELNQLTETCLTNARLTPAFLNQENPLKSIGLQAGKIKHVIYVIKENRTYDHVLGDLPQGNGDPNRCVFPRAVTPNLHALAERFILLDNFYDSGEVSGDGWTWSTQAQANEYTIRNVPYQYSGRGRVFDYEGTNNEYPTGGFPAKGPDGKPLSDDPRFKEGGKAVPDVAASPGGHLWDLARKQGLTYRNFGFFMTNGIKKGEKVVLPDNYPAVPGLQPGGHDLGGVSDMDFRRFDLEYPDSEAPSIYARQLNDAKYLWARKEFGMAGSVSRFSEFKREFDIMLAKDASGAAVPNLMTLRLGTDHTLGANPGKPTPRCMVADNDYAIGQLAELISHSPIWKSTAIIVIEDDAQNGPDHVDAHRSTCYVISPWMAKATIDHTFQNTVSTIRTIECLLGLPGMCQYDAASDIIGGWDDAPRNDEPYAAILPSAEIMKERSAATNLAVPASPEQPDEAVPGTRPLTRPATKPAASSVNRPMRSADDLAIASMEMDFAHADRAPADVLNRIIWKMAKGYDSEMPPTPHVPAAGGATKDDDDD